MRKDLKELDREFEERNKQYDIFEKDVNSALKAGDKEKLKEAFSKILEVYNS